VSGVDDLITRVGEILATTPDRWRVLTASIEPDLLARRPAPGEWSALECLQHIVDTEVGAFSVRVESFLEGRDFENFDPDAPGFRPKASAAPADLAVQLGEARARSLARLATLTVADLGRTAIHSELGSVTMREMLNEWAAHDLMHTVQAERALMQPFVAESGKWRAYFADHDTEAGG
jgi:hypothetical protein